MDVFEAIESRRSIKGFTDREITREEIERLLETVVLAPNHRMTQPWSFLVLGKEGTEAYARVLGGRRTKRIDDPDVAEKVMARTLRGITHVPVTIAVTIRQDEDPEIREEDYAATYMGIQNLLLAATAEGLGTHVKTGAVMNDPKLREALGVEDDRRVIALIQLGEPAEIPDAKERATAASVTKWLP